MIKSAEEFKSVVNTLCLDLAGANDHFELFRKLNRAREEEFERALSQSQTFWFLTLRAHLETAVFRLGRAYDQNPNNLGLKGFLEIVKAPPDFLKPTEFYRLDPVRLESEREWVSRDTNRLVRHLMKWRHKVYAHRDVQVTVSGDLARSYPITFDEVGELLRRGFDIVNHYNGVFLGAHFSRQILALDDYSKLLKTIEADLAAREARLEELRRAVLAEQENSQT
ncbi:MAG TPA: hypothetical protein VJN96_03345 [Vicinamibacterales bacterium]|nr:hypothetical protein [Vicinamibacterales bacterium]